MGLRSWAFKGDARFHFVSHLLWFFRVTYTKIASKEVFVFKKSLWPSYFFLPHFFLSVTEFIITSKSLLIIKHVFFYYHFYFYSFKLRWHSLMPRRAPNKGVEPFPYIFWVQYLTRFVLTWFVRESNPDCWIESPARLPLNHGLTPHQTCHRVE